VTANWTRKQARADSDPCSAICPDLPKVVWLCWQETSVNVHQERLPGMGQLLCAGMQRPCYRGCAEKREEQCRLIRSPHRRGRGQILTHLRQKLPRAVGL